MNHRILLSFFVLLLATKILSAQDKICNIWYTDGNTSTVQIFVATDGKYYGKITWLRNGVVNGKPLLDKHNPDETKRNKPWLGLQIITGLTKKSSTEYVTGRIYDPSKGNYYNCKMTMIGDNKLELRGYILGIPFLGRTTTWTLKEEKSKPVTTPNLVQSNSVN